MGFELDGKLWSQLFVHEQTTQLRCLMTTLCDKNAHRSEWVFTADRVCRYVRIALDFNQRTSMQF